MMQTPPAASSLTISILSVTFFLASLGAMLDLLRSGGFNAANGEAKRRSIGKVGCAIRVDPDFPGSLQSIRERET